MGAFYRVCSLQLLAVPAGGRQGGRAADRTADPYRRENVQTAQAPDCTLPPPAETRSLMGRKHAAVPFTHPDTISRTDVLRPGAGLHDRPRDDPADAGPF